MLNDKLKNNRELFNLTQKQMADVLNIERSTYTYYELGRSLPTIDTLVKIARIFNVSLDDLLEHTVVTAADMVSDNVSTYKRAYENTSVSALSTEEQALILNLRSLALTSRKDIIKKSMETIDKLKTAII